MIPMHMSLYSRSIHHFEVPMKRLLLFCIPALLFLVAGCSQQQDPLSSQPSPLGKDATVQGAGDDAVPGAYIVILSDDLQENEPVSLKNLGVKIASLHSRHNFEVMQQWGAAVKGFSARMDAATASDLARDPDVKLVEPDRYVHTCAQSLPWGINWIDADVSSTAAGDGTGTVSNVEVYVIDTGIDTSHPDLNVVGGINYSSGGSTNYKDGNGHGTHVAGTIAAKDNAAYVVGVAPGAPLYAVRVLGNGGSGTTSGVISGVNWVTSRTARSGHLPMVANMSLGGSVSASLDQAVANSIAAGVTYCIAAGNENKDASTSSPARVPTAITVGAIDQSGAKASFSNFGSLVDIQAPGVNILSTYKGSSTATLSGTSMATPHVTGSAALYLSTHPTATPAMVRNALVAAGRANVTGEPSGTTNISVYVATF
jgi:subtilisin family serine protease